MTTQDFENGSDVGWPWGFLAGLLVGGIIGAVAVLLLTPQSGGKTRAQIQRKSAELREQTADTVEASLVQARTKAGHISDDIRKTTDELEHRAQEVLGEQSERLTSVVQAGKKAIREGIG